MKTEIIAKAEVLLVLLGDESIIAKIGTESSSNYHHDGIQGQVGGSMGGGKEYKQGESHELHNKGKNTLYDHIRHLKRKINAGTVTKSEEARYKLALKVIARMPGSKSRRLIIRSII